MYRYDPSAPRTVEPPKLRPAPLDAPPADRPPTASEPDLLEAEPSASRIARAGRRNLHEKFVAGLLGIKCAVRGDSSFFAHAYRALLIFLIAGMIGVSPLGWCLLVMALGLVLIAEINHSAVDTLARAIGDPDAPRLKMARDIAAAGVLVAVVVSATIWITVITLKLGEYLGWWDHLPWEWR
jgi:diacylglycerol kinase